MASLKKTIKKTLGKTLNELSTQFAKEIALALVHVSVEELRDALAGLRGEHRVLKNPSRSSKRSKRAPTKTSHKVEMAAANVVAHLKENGPLRSEELRRALGMSREDMTKALALALEWKMVSKSGQKRATVYKAVKARGPKVQLTLGDRMRVAAALGK